jgi:hypothetical protein
MTHSDLLNGLFQYLDRLDYVVSVDLAGEQIRVRPSQRLMENGQPIPPELTLRIPAVEFEKAWPELERGGRILRPGIDPERAAFGLFDIHVSETIDSLKIPGSRGFIYRNGRFDPWD